MADELLCANTLTMDADIVERFVHRTMVLINRLDCALCARPALELLDKVVYLCSPKFYDLPEDITSYVQKRYESLELPKQDEVAFDDLHQEVRTRTEKGETESLGITHEARVLDDVASPPDTDTNTSRLHKDKQVLDVEVLQQIFSADFPGFAP